MMTNTHVVQIFDVDVDVDVDVVAVALQALKPDMDELI